MKTFILALILSSCLPAQFSTIKSELTTSIRTIKYDDKFYQVEYTYDKYGPVSLPAVANVDNQLHYDATIRVYEIEKGERHPIGFLMSGKYTERGCFEDDPELFVKRAIDEKDLPLQTNGDPKIAQDKPKFSTNEKGQILWSPMRVEIKQPEDPSTTCVPDKKKLEAELLRMITVADYLEETKKATAHDMMTVVIAGLYRLFSCPEK